MRVALGLAFILLAACASEKLAMAPPHGVDFTGRWKLNEAESDDPQRLVLSQIAGPTNGPGDSGSGQGGQGGRGGGRGGRGGRGGGLGGAGPSAPSLPAIASLSEGLRWPGKELEIKQVAGVVAITSGGDSRIYQPAPGDRRRDRRKPADGADARDMRARTLGDGPPRACGWDDKTLVVLSDDPDGDDPPFEQRYSVSDDGQRLVEVIGFTRGRSAGFTISRVWDRDSGTPAPTASKSP